VGGRCGPRYQAFKREELEELGIKWGRMEEAFEEGQGPHRAVDPVMMMMNFNIILPFEPRSSKLYICVCLLSFVKQIKPYTRNM
jgi:hypothetical protein